MFTKQLQYALAITSKAPLTPAATASTATVRARTVTRHVAILTAFKAASTCNQRPKVNTKFQNTTYFLYKSTRAICFQTKLNATARLTTATTTTSISVGTISGRMTFLITFVALASTTACHNRVFRSVQHNPSLNVHPLERKHCNDSSFDTSYHSHAFVQ